MPRSSGRNFAPSIWFFGPPWQFKVLLTRSVAADPWSWSAVRGSRSRAHGPRSAVIGPWFVVRELQATVPLRLLGYLVQRNATAGQRSPARCDCCEQVEFADRSSGRDRRRVLTLCSHLLFVICTGDHLYKRPAQPAVGKCAQTCSSLVPFWD